jgi:ABC-type phosphate/phosphonate transport system substrate-binding protein
MKVKTIIMFMAVLNIVCIEKEKSSSQDINMFYRHFDWPETLIFTILPRRRHGRRRQYEAIQKMLYETSLAIAKIYLPRG